MKSSLAFIIAFLWFLSAHAQESTDAGFLPRINLSTTLSSNWKLVNSVESRHFIYGDGELMYDYALTDVLTLISYRISPGRSANTGYTLRLREDKVFHRFTQQYNLVSRYSNFRIGHRLSSDQTFASREKTVFRFRYRLLYEKPFSGDRVDPKEYYFKLGNEYLVAIDKDDTDLEVRLLFFLGYEVNPKNKIETGFDYRLNRFLLSRTRHRFLLGLTWYRSI